MATRTELDINQIAILSSNFASRNLLNKWLDAYQDEMNYFDVMEMMGGAVVSTNSTFQSLTEDSVQRTALTVGTTTAAAAGTNQTVVLSPNGAVPNKNEIILFPNGVTAAVVSVTFVSPNWSVVLKPLGGTNGSTIVIPATTATMTLAISSNFIGEGGKATQTVRQAPSVLRSNYIQTFSTFDEITNIAGATHVPIEYDGSFYLVNKAKAQQLLIHKMQAFNQMIFGVKGTTTDADGKPAYLTSGLRTQIKNDGGFTLPTIGAGVYDIIADTRALSVAMDIARGPSEYNVLCGRTFQHAVDSNSAANASFGGGGISYASYGNNKDIALAIGVKSISFGSHQIHFQRFKALEHKGLTGGVGYESSLKEAYLVPFGKTKVKGGADQDRARIRYMSYNGNKDLRFIDHEGGILSPNKPTNDLTYNYTIYSQQGLELCGVEQFGLMNVL